MKKRLELMKNSVNYPNILKEIKDPPKKLNYIGNIELLKKPGIAIVGSRNCSKYGKQIATKFAEELSQFGLNIISGLAKGIDSYAHIGALNVGGSTIAVLPSGLENIYPKENIKLFNKILDTGGLIVSEYESNFEANYKSFLDRNRIVSGLSNGLLVVEGTNRSGTRVTARITAESNKKVFCIPSSLNNSKGYTPNFLIRNGGILVTCAEEIIMELTDLNLKKEVQKNYIKEVDNKYKDIFDLIGDEPISINEIIEVSNKNFEEINYKIMMLELEGFIVSLPGKCFKRKDLYV